ncbi:tryptophan synthase subunit beta [Mycoplasmatota bacterium zrk1]
MKHQFGNFGGQYVPEVVVNALNQLESYFVEAMEDPLFISKYKYYLKNYVGRPSSLYFAKNMTEDLKGAKVYLKREDLNHTGAHKINNCIGQILIALRMGKNKIIAETGAGQHGVATATAAAMFGMECEIFMGQEDIERQELNVYKMEMLGAKVTAVKTGTKTLSDAVDHAIGEWVKRIDDTFYLLGSAVGPHPYPIMVREFQKVIGQETYKQILEVEDKVDYAIACVGGGSNAIGLFYPLLDKGVKLIGVEGAGKGLDTDLHAATMAIGKKGIIHGMNTIYVQDSKGEVSPVYSISAGLDYPGVGPEHAYLKEMELAEYVSVTDKEAINAFKYLSKTEGIIPAIESSHAVAHALKIVPGLKETDVVIISISGRGDKDMDLVRSFK